jgi:hypothetical protein
MKYVNQCLVIILVFSATISNGMQFGGAAVQVLRRNASLIPSFRRLKLQPARSFNASTTRKGSFRLIRLPSDVNGAINSKQAQLVDFQASQRTDNTEREIAAIINEYNYCVGKTIELLKEPSYVPFELEGIYLNQLDPENDSKYIYFTFPYRSECSLRKNVYVENRLNYLRLIYARKNLLEENYGKYLAYRAIEYKDYKMVMVLLRLGFNMYQEIEVKGVTCRLIDLCGDKLRSILKLVIQRKHIS